MRCGCSLVRLLLLLVAVQAYQPPPVVSWTRSQQSLGLGRLRLGSQIFALPRPANGWQPRAATLPARPKPVDAVLKAPAYLALARGLEQAATSETPADIVSPLVQELLQTGIFDSPAAWTPKPIIQVLNAAHLTNDVSLQKDVWRASAPVLARVVPDMNTKGVAAVFGAMRDLLASHHLFPWFEGILNVLTARIQAIDVSLWPVNDVMRMIQSVAGANDKQRGLSELTLVLAGLIKKLSGQFSASQLSSMLHALKRLYHSRRVNKLPSALAEELVQTADWTGNNTWSAISCALCLHGATTSSRIVAKAVAKELVQTPLPSANESSRVLLAFAQLRHQSHTNPEMAALVNAFEPHVLQAAKLANNTNDAFLLAAVAGLRSKSSSPAANNVLNTLASLLEQTEYCRNPRLLCHAFSGLEGYDPNFQDVGRLLTILTDRLNASIEIPAISHLDGLTSLLRPCRTFLTPTVEVRRYWATLAAAIKSSNVTRGDASLSPIYLNMGRLPWHVQEARELFHALLEVVKNVPRRNGYDQDLDSIFFQVARWNLTIPAARAHLNDLLDRPLLIHPTNVAAFISVASRLPKGDPLVAKVLNTCGSCLSSIASPLEFPTLRAIAKGMRILPFDQSVRRIFGKLTPLMPRVTLKQSLSLAPMFTNMPIDDPIVRALQDRLEPAREKLPFDTRTSTQDPYATRRHNAR